VVDQKVNHGNTKLTCYTRATPRRRIALIFG
jgi:hypothetical protein